MKKQEIWKKIIEYETKGAILRSKWRWHNEGEKNTKYFLNLKKRHYKNSVITQFKVSDTDFITSDKELNFEWMRNLLSRHLQLQTKFPW